MAPVAAGVQDSVPTPHKTTVGPVLGAVHGS